MSELLISGFEEPIVSSFWSAVAGTAAIDATVFHSGLHSLKITPSGSSASSVRRDFSNPTVGAFYSRFYLYVGAIGVAVDPSIYEHQSSAVAPELMVRLMRTGVLKLQNVIATTEASTTTVLSLNTWYRVEIGHLLSDTVGTMELRLYLGDSTTLLESALVLGPEDTLSTNVGLAYFGQRTTPSSTCTVYYDDARINYVAAVDGLPAEWPGPGKTAIQLGNADTAVAWLDDDGVSASTFANVDDYSGSPPGASDDTTTYNATTSNSLDDRFAITLPAEVPSNAVLSTLSLWCRPGADGTTGTLALKVWDENGTATTGINITVTGAFTTLTTGQHVTMSLSGKTKANLAQWSIGYRSVTGTNQRRVTALWANVEWLESSGVTAAQIVPAFQFPGAMIGRRYV